MAEQDYKVVYRSRIVPRNSSGTDQDRRRRVPTALDPYDYPYDVEPLHRSTSRYEPDNSSTVESTSTLTAPNRATKTTYSAKGRESEAYVDIDRSKRNGPSRNATSGVDDTNRRSSRYIEVDRASSDIPRPQRSRNFDEPRRPDRSREALDFEVERPRITGSKYDYVVDDRVRRDGGAYIIDARREEVIDIGTPGRKGSAGPRYLYSDSASQPNVYYDDRRYREVENLASGVTVLRRDVTPPGQSRRKYQEEPKLREYDRDDDWRIVESMRETKIDSARFPTNNATTRSRAPTQSSEDSFVMVSPTQTQERPSVRSAMRRADYPPSEINRRRSRSITFRDIEVESHDCSERRHERPGAEAELCGVYLRSRSQDSYDTHSTYQSSQPRRRQSRSRRGGDTVQDYNKDEYREPYAPQQGYDPPKRRRSHSTRRRKSIKDDIDDDESYYSDRKTYIKETRYR